MNNDDLDVALGRAVQDQFCKLFSVLVSSPSDPHAFQHFEAGLKRLIELESQVKTLLEAGQA